MTARLSSGVGLWQRIRDKFIRQDEPSLTQNPEPDASSVQYPTVELGEAHGGEESIDEQREGEGFR
jgi:hypothetical protein